MSEKVDTRMDKLTCFLYGANLMSVTLKLGYNIVDEFFYLSLIFVLWIPIRAVIDWARTYTIKVEKK